MTARAATEADLDFINTLAAATALPPVALEELEHPRALALVLEGAGFLLATVVAGDCELHAIAVRPELRRRGWARTLLHQAFTAAQNRGATAMFLEVRAKNEAARAFYSVEGFEESGVRRHYYADGEDAILMRRVLVEPGVIR